MPKRRQIINALPYGKFTHRCQTQNGHGRPWFHADGLVFDKDVKN
ncbi:conserved hypothetical protein [Treponema phagedenis]|uniref:Uncharacterized protein n=1 Tax=Treponema phagedenis TaxID=162 RepID=A0A0B7GW52_TREPH|nr:conserved hypothetical protein [Treponema phagedenis]